MIHNETESHGRRLLPDYPSLCSRFSTLELRRLIRPRFLVENSLTFLIGFTVCYLVIPHVRFPFVSIGLV